MGKVPDMEDVPEFAIKYFKKQIHLATINPDNKLKYIKNYSSWRKTADKMRCKCDNIKDLDEQIDELRLSIA